MASDLITKRPPTLESGLPAFSETAKAGVQPRVIIVVLNWNNAEDTLECLESLNSLAYENYQVLVLDNGSTDGSVERIRTGVPEVEILERGTNLGFGGANNRGIRRAISR